MWIYNYLDYLLKKSPSLTEAEKQLIFTKSLLDRNFAYYVIDVLEDEDKKLADLKQKYINRLDRLALKYSKEILFYSKILHYEKVKRRLNAIKIKEVEQNDDIDLDLLLNQI